VKTLNAIILLLLPLPLLAQVCNDAIPRKAFDARYEVDMVDPTIVTDTATGLQWKRCVIGYVLNDNDGDLDYTNHSCDEPAENTDDDEETAVTVSFFWNDAIAAAADAGGGWRLPNIKELNSLVEVACHTPAINPEIFPDTVGTDYWSSTPSNFGDDREIWTVNFTDGDNKLTSKGTRLPVRLVRD
jgi:hypothetical protein